MHPTALELVKTVDNLMNVKSASQITAEEVLTASSISKGSMYHHFEDLYDLIEITYIYRYSKWIHLTIEQLTKLLTSVTSAQELKLALFRVTSTTQNSSISQIRLERARMFASAEGNPRMQNKVIEETEKITSILEDLIREVINKGFFKPNLDARTVAIFIQAYTFGVIINDFTENKLADKNWIDFINSVIESMLINE